MASKLHLKMQRLLFWWVQLRTSHRVVFLETLVAIAVNPLRCPLAGVTMNVSTGGIFMRSRRISNTLVLPELVSSIFVVARTGTTLS